MTQNIRWGMYAIVGLIFIWLLIQMNNMNNSNVKLQDQLISLQSDASYFSSLKKRWNKKNVKRELLTKLSQVKSFDKRFTKGSNEVIVYKSLDANMLEKISYIIFTTNILLVDVSMEKEGQYVSLSVEMKE